MTFGAERVIKMVKRKDKNETVKETVNTRETEKEKIKEEKKPSRKPCNQCRWYDKSTEREFHRKVGKRNEKGERTEIVEIRAVCRCKKARAYGRLVHATLTKRSCPHWEPGVYVTPKKEEKVKEKAEEKTSEPTAPHEYFGPDLDKMEKENLKNNVAKASEIDLKRVTRANQRKIKNIVLKNERNGETKTFEKKGRRMVLVKQ